MSDTRQAEGESTRHVGTSSFLWKFLIVGSLFTLLTNIVHYRTLYNIYFNDDLHRKDINHLYGSDAPPENMSSRPPPGLLRLKSTSMDSQSDQLPAVGEKILKEGSHRIAGLSCEKYGGPVNDSWVKDEMVYWEDIPSDAKYASPYFSNDEKYLTFEPDHGGWNNIRMSMETVMVAAHAMGRTLVLPPEQDFYLLNNKESKHDFTFADFFHLDTIHLEQYGLNIITMEEFLERIKADPGVPSPSGNIKNFRNQMNANVLWPYIRSIGHHLNSNEWDPSVCTAIIPEKPSQPNYDHIKEVFQEILDEKITSDHFTGKPVQVNGTLKSRLSENFSDRKKICIYESEMQEARILHLGTKRKGEGARLLTHFYSFLFFESWSQDLFYKRFIRDHVRYNDEIMCAAARLIEEIRKVSTSSGNAGVYDSLHVRRGDFQYKKTRITAHQIYTLTKDRIPQNTTLYIATDERDLNFFSLLKKHYKKVVFLNDFSHVLEGTNKNFYGMIEQIVNSRSRIYFGTWWSTFSGYTNRMRGYHTNKLHKGHHDGTLPNSWYFIPQDRVHEMHEYHAVRLPIYMREFPTSWKDIDLGIKELIEENHQ